VCPVCIFSSSFMTLAMILTPSCQYRDSLARHVQSVPQYDRCLGLSTVGHFPASRSSAFACLTRKSLSRVVVESFATNVLVRYEESVQHIISKVKHQGCK